MKERIHELAVVKDDTLVDFRKDIPEDGSTIVINEKMDNETKRAVFDLLKERVKIYEEQAERSELSAETYLWLANAGFAAAIITLEARTGAAIQSLAMKAALVCFMFSIALIGYIKAIRIVRNYRLKGQFRKNYFLFMRGEISLEKYFNLDRNVWKEPKQLIYSGWICYILFFLGVLLSVMTVLLR